MFALLGTTIISDCWKAYDRLNEHGFEHLKVNHSINFKDPDTGAHTNKIESTWRASKAICPASGRRKKFFAGYLAKYMFLKQCRIRKSDPFKDFMAAAGELYHPQ